MTTLKVLCWRARGVHSLPQVVASRR
ncbi:hypothetical protein E2C01_099039 [Portunus trituberculatus]|uniref:Uncharacterized protein n=1 Tax=Portunus trituberculatus TaxID=210409 RepID=A0A5B7K2S6_PORTR|nr:hypothetical protein [Portunus trituberculatus]